MYIDYSRPPFVDIALPPAHILPAHKLILLYSATLLFDFILLRNEYHVNKVISPFQLRFAMAIYHIIIPMIYISSYPPANILYAAGPWFLASYSAHMPTEDLTAEKWVRTLFKITIEDEQGTNTSKIRLQGLSKIALGIFKIAFMHLFINPLLPHHAEYALDYPWLHPMSLMYTVLYGVKAYCMLGIVDVFMGVEQSLFAWNMVPLFNSPIIASSPRDFWSRRWNRVIRNLLHKQVFTLNTAKEEAVNMSHTTVKATTRRMKKTVDKTIATSTFEKRVTRAAARRAAEIATTTTTTTTTTTPVVAENHHPTMYSLLDSSDDSKQKNIRQTNRRSLTFWSTSQGRGLLSFIISGIFHELIIMSACRRITLENLVFFTFHGIVCMIEVEIRQGALKQEPTGRTRVLCIALQLLFMAITGRLFIGPFLRYNFFTYT